MDLKHLQSFIKQEPVQAITESHDADFGEMLDMYMTLERMHQFEGSRGVRNFEKLIKDVGGYRSLDEFLEDNSGAFEAIINWMMSVNVPEWKENLGNIIGGSDEHQDE